MKKICIVLLALFLSLLPAVSVGEESVVVRFSSLDGLQASAGLTFDADWFSADAHVYQHGLCRISLGMALSAFRGADTAPDAAIRAFFSDLNFEEPAIAQFDEKNRNSIGTAISHRMIEADGESFPLIAVAVSGGNYGDEWLSNFDVGTGDVHQGFFSAAQIVFDRISAYVQENKLENPRFWLSGYSRGAAVSNIAATLLAQNHLASDELIFAYTFATPRTVKITADDSHQNIFNIVHIADLVPHVPLAGWGYDRYGKTIYLPSSLSENLNYDNLTGSYLAAYQSIQPDTSFASADYAFADMASKIARGMHIAVPTVEKYRAAYQIIAEKLVSGESLSDTETLLAGLLLRNISAAALGNAQSAAISGGTEQALQALSGLLPALTQHMPENYLAWLLSIDDEKILFENSLTLTNGLFF